MTTALMIATPRTIARVQESRANPLPQFFLITQIRGQPRKDLIEGPDPFPNSYHSSIHGRETSPGFLQRGGERAALSDPLEEQCDKLAPGAAIGDALRHLDRVFQ